MTKIIRAIKNIRLKINIFDILYVAEAFVMKTFHHAVAEEEVRKQCDVATSYTVRLYMTLVVMFSCVLIVV